MHSPLRIFLSRWLLLLACAALCCSFCVEGFTVVAGPPSHPGAAIKAGGCRISAVALQFESGRRRRSTVVRRLEPESSGGSDEPNDGTPSSGGGDGDDASSTSSPAAAVTTTESTEKPYPIDLPSPVLLSLSMVLAIASTGSLFDVMGGSPALGLPAAVALVVVGLPSCLLLFYASILKARAETEEDDAAFLGKKGK